MRWFLQEAKTLKAFVPTYQVYQMKQDSMSDNDSQ